MYRPRTAFRFRILSLILLMSSWSVAADIVVDFEELDMEAESVLVGDASQDPIVSQGIVFNRTFEFDFPVLGRRAIRPTS